MKLALIVGIYRGGRRPCLPFGFNQFIWVKQDHDQKNRNLFHERVFLKMHKKGLEF